MTQQNAEVALGVKVFKRTKALERLLNSAKQLDISTVYVADDGDTSDRTDIYDRSWPFDIQLIDLEFDAGVGAGRAAIVDELEEPYLMMADPDIYLSSSIESLVEILEKDESLGGVAPMLLEAGRPKAFCHNFSESRSNHVLRRGVWEEPTVETISDKFLIRWDFIPNTAVYRRAALSDYHWDPAYVNAKDHLDMFVGHWRKTNWDFAVCPHTVVRHSDVSENSLEYQQERGSRSKAQDAKSYFLDKWGYRQVFLDSTWFDWESYHPPAPDQWLAWTPPAVRAAALDLYDWVDKNR